MNLRRQALRLVVLFNREPSTILAVAAAIGIAVGLVVVAFYRAIDLVQSLVLQGVAQAPLDVALVIPGIVALGLVASRALVRWGARGSDGENIADVMHAIASRSGRMRFGPVAAKTLASALLIGTGSSVGPEGPVVVAGAATGSRLGRWFSASPDRLKTLVGAGSAAGIAAAFNAPIAGVLFVAEKMLGAFGAASFAPVVVAAVLAAVVGRAVFGDEPVIRVPTEYALGSPREMLLYALLGIAAGVVALVYSRGVYRTQDWLVRLRRPWVRVAVAALVIGGLDVWFRADLWGKGHESLDLGIVVERAPWFLLGLAAAKIVATCLSLGVGRAGGVFTPALFIGATLGGGLGSAFAQIFPDWGLAPEAFAVVGMAGLVAGSTHAPLTAMMMVFEMTGDYALILPLMLCAAIAFLVARRAYPESIYTEWLARRGIHLAHGADAALLTRLSVAECFNRRAHTFREDTALADMLTTIRGSRQTIYPVVDAASDLRGIVRTSDLRDVLEAGATFGAIVLAGDVMHEPPATVTPDDSLLTALRRIGGGDLAAVPVVEGERGHRWLGLLTRDDLFSAYERALTEQSY